MADLPTRPELTLPPAEAEAVRAAYAGAGVILEYGSGGSTVLAAEMPGKTLFSVESDAAWAASMVAWFAANPPASPVEVHAVDIGPTKEWGHPVDASGWRHYHRYPLSVWDRDDFRHPDVVLVDGRFRVGCFLAVLHRISRPVTLLFDDYTPRPGYHLVEDWVKPAAITGRMARFDLTPRALPMAEMARFIELLTRPA